MPVTREDHITYTREEFLGDKYSYYIKLREFLKRNNNIKSYLDLGANVGETWNIIKSLVPSIEKAYLVEAHPNNYTFMLSNIQYSAICECFNVAIDYSGKEYLFLQDDPYGNIGGYLLRDNSNGTRVACRTLEALNIPPVDFVKIDVEGCEYDILKNSSYIKDCKYLEIEFHGPERSLNFRNPKTFIEYNFKNYKLLLTDLGPPGIDYYRVLLEKA